MKKNVLAQSIGLARMIETIQKWRDEAMKLNQELQLIMKELHAIRNSKEPVSKSIIEQTAEEIKEGKE